MAARKRVRVRFNEKELRSPDFVLPSRRVAADVIHFGLFDWALEKFCPNESRSIRLTCSECPKNYTMCWPINTSTLMFHFKRHHVEVLKRLREDAIKSKLPVRDTILRSCIFDDEFRKASSSPDQSVTKESFEMILSSHKRGPTYVYFDLKVFRLYLLNFIVSNSLPYVLVDNHSFKLLLEYLKDDLAFSVSSFTVHSDLNNVFEKERDWLKLKLALNENRFALALDKRRFENGDEILAITLHYFNDAHDLEPFTIGFGWLNKHSFYIGDTIYKCLENTLMEYGIKDCIVSITKGIGGPVNGLLQKFTRSTFANELQISGEVQCAKKVFNLVTEVILTYTFFKTKRTKRFEKILQDISSETPAYGDLASSLEALPGKLRSIITGISHNHYMKNAFAEIVGREKTDLPTKACPKSLVKDNKTHWLSTYNMIDQFLCFRSEITEVLILVSQRNKFDGSNHFAYEISDFEWDYLSIVRDVLDIFRKPTLKLEASSRSAISLTLPCVCKVLMRLEEFSSSGLEARNPYLAFGLLEASKKLLEYYPLRSGDIEPIKNLCLATVLDPRYKLGFFESLEFPQSAIDGIKAYFYKVYSHYAEEFEEDFAIYRPEVIESPLARSPIESIQAEEESDDNYFLEDASDAKDVHEIEAYLNEKRISWCPNIMMYHNEQRQIYPIIYRIARDFLAISATSATSDALFSRVTDPVTKERGQTLSSTIKMLAVITSNDNFSVEADRA